MVDLQGLALSAADQAFLSQAVEACNRAGPRAVLLLVGSRAAGFAGRGSDLDLWIVGDRMTLPVDQQRQLDAKESLFVDRGDLTAHWTFYDHDDLVHRLLTWPSEIMWTLATAQHLHGDRQVFIDLRTRFNQFPRHIAEPKLRWLIGAFRMRLSPIYKLARRGDDPGAMVQVGHAVDAFCRLCRASECQPWPYEKWLTAVARQTRIGTELYPLIKSCVEIFLQTPRPASVSIGSDWPPHKLLRDALYALPPLLHELGWQGDWVDDPWKAVSETFKRPAP